MQLLFEPTQTAKGLSTKYISGAAVNGGEKIFAFGGRGEI